VNSTFYGQPRPEVTRAWVERTPADFEFSVKLYQKFTHPRMFKERLADGLPAEARTDTALVDALARPNDADLDEFPPRHRPARLERPPRRAARAVSGELQGDTASRDYLAAVLRAFAGYPVAVELRHRSWSDSIADTLALLNNVRSGVGAD